MTLCVTESFDPQVTTGSMTAGTPQYNYLHLKHGRLLAGSATRQGGLIGSNTMTNNVGSGLHGGNAWNCQANTVGGGLATILDSAQEDDVLIVGVAYNLTPGGAWRDGSGILAFGETRISGGSGVRTIHIYLEATSVTGEVAVRTANKAGTSLATFQLPQSGWYYLEMRVKCHDTAGEVQVRLTDTAGVTTTPVNLTNVDTRNTGTGVTGLMNTVVLGNFIAVAIGASFSVQYDDWYVCNEQGSAPTNTFLGPVSVYALAPTGAGNSTQWTPSVAPNWDAVADPTNTAPLVTDYVSAAADNLKDTYVAADLPVGSPYVPLAVAVYAHGQKQDVGSRSLALVGRVGANESQQADVPMKGTGAGSAEAEYQRYVMEAKPGGGAWTLADVNNLEIGYVSRP